MSRRYFYLLLPIYFYGILSQTVPVPYGGMMIRTATVCYFISLSRAFSTGRALICRCSEYLFKWLFPRVLASPPQRPGCDSRPGHVSPWTSSLWWRWPWSLRWHLFGHVSSMTSLRTCLFDDISSDMSVLGPLVYDGDDLVKSLHPIYLCVSGPGPAAPLWCARPLRLRGGLPLRCAALCPAHSHGALHPSQRRPGTCVPVFRIRDPVPCWPLDPGWKIRIQIWIRDEYPGS